MSDSPRTTSAEAHPLQGVGLIVFAIIVGCAAHVDAHPISIVVETAFVEADQVTIDVECFAEDLYFYHDLKPNQENEATADSLRQAAVAHGPLLLERLPVFDLKGRTIEGGKVASVTGDEFTENIPLGELMGYNLVYRLELPLEAPPEFLSFGQRLVDENAGFPALVDFRVKQSGRDDEVEATLKPGNIRTVRFDWSGSQAPTDDESRETWMQARRDDMLGATALNTVRSFLYVARREVRHELLIPFPLVESFFTVEREQPDFLSPNEQDAAQVEVADYFRTKNPLSIDGTTVEPAAIRVEFFTLEDRDLTQSPKRRTVSAVNARVGVILSYPLERPAGSVKLHWKAFNRQAWRVDAFCFAGDDVQRPKFSMATRDDTFVWTRPAPPSPLEVKVATAPPPPRLSVPWLALLIGGFGVVGGLSLRSRRAVAGGMMATGLVVAAAAWQEPRWTFSDPFAGTPVVSQQEADEIVNRLHHNLYLATDASTEDEALEALAAAADGELLRELYLRLIRTFREADESGTLPVTEDVAILDGRKVGEPSPSGGFDYRCRWEVAGRVEHWGHVHTRKYRYEALFRLEPRSSRWTMTSMDLRDARLVQDEAIGML
ncbi:MAG: hypothetical protein WBC44_22460 [Planctomycetaceae bacterium]